MGFGGFYGLDGYQQVQVQLHISSLDLDYVLRPDVGVIYILEDLLVVPLLHEELIAVVARGTFIQFHVACQFCSFLDQEALLIVADDFHLPVWTIAKYFMCNCLGSFKWSQMQEPI